MNPFFPVDRSIASPPRKTRAMPAGQAIYPAGGSGLAWRLRHGVVRLDSYTPTGEASFASLVVAGDILGCETLLFGAYTSPLPP